MTVTDLDDLEALKTAFDALGNQLAELHRRVEIEATSAAPTDPREVAAIVNDLIAGLRTIFPATIEPWRSIGEIARDDVIPKLVDRMQEGGANDH
jgi:hypothetical protein